MSIESDAASQVVGIYTQGLTLGAQVAIKVGEATFKLSGEALKELVKFFAGVIRQNGKEGRLLLTNMLTRAANEGKTISIIRINSKEDFDKLAPELKSHGVTFAKARGKNCYDVMFFEEDAPRINIILEKLGLNTVEKVTEAKAEPVDVKEDPFADDTYYEQELPFDDENLTEHEDFDEYVDDFFGKNKEKKRGDKENEVPTEDRDEPNKKDGQPEKKSEKEKQRNTKPKDSRRKIIDEKKTERADRTSESTQKAAEAVKDVKQGVKTRS